MANTTNTLAKVDSFDWPDGDEDSILDSYMPPEPDKTEDELHASRTKLFQTGSEFKPTRRNEIVGIDNVLIEIDSLIHWLANSAAYQKYEARLEPGVIFEGDPGTGKTLVSRYIATESNALFINVRDFAHNGSLYRDADIADLFQRARKVYAESKRPIVLFWDEFENASSERKNGTPDQAATVSQLTAELDGIHGKNEGLLLIGCTNYFYGIDGALRRPGRMGLQIEFTAPDRHGKRLLLEHYLGVYNCKGKIDVETLSYFLEDDDTAAGIEEACMEAWRVSVAKKIKNGTKGRPQMTQEDLVEVFLKRLVGPPTAFVNLPPEDRVGIAIHEAGHAIMALVFGIPLRLITVQPGKKSLGRVITAQVKEHIGTFDEMVSDMRVGVGSIAAEKIADLPLGVGSTSDISTVNAIAARLVDDLHGGMQTGMFSPRAVGSTRSSMSGGAEPSISDEAIKNSDADVKHLLGEVERDAERVMDAIGHDDMWAIATRVNEDVTLTGVQFKTMFEDVTGRPPHFYRPKARD